MHVLVLNDEPIPVGALVTVRLIGLIEGDQTQDGNTVRNDRLPAVTSCSHQYERITDVEQLGETFVDHLTQFWVNYNAVKGKTFDVIGVYGAERATHALENATETRGSG